MACDEKWLFVCLKLRMDNIFLNFALSKMCFQGNAGISVLVTKSFLNCFNEFQDTYAYINMHEKK